MVEPPASGSAFIRGVFLFADFPAAVGDGVCRLYPGVSIKQVHQNILDIYLPRYTFGEFLDEELDDSGIFSVGFDALPLHYVLGDFTILAYMASPLLFPVALRASAS